jgi:hypothetical protein
MLTASVSNRSLLIFSDVNLTGINTNLVYVVSNNTFSSYVLSSQASRLINLNLNFSVAPKDTIVLRVFPGGITGPSYNPGITSNITVVNSTVYLDSNAPSLLEVISTQNYNFTSFLYSNYFASNSSSGYPSASLFLKRNPPSGDIIINEGFQGPMYLRRFAAMSSTYFQIPSGLQTSFIYSAFAFNYISFGGHNINSCVLPLSWNTSISTNSNVTLSIVQDYLGQPGSASVGISSVVDLSTLTSGNVIFGFSPSIYLPTGKYWFVFSPTTSSAVGLGVSNKFYIGLSTLKSLYSTKLYYSKNGILYQSLKSIGVAATILSDRGIVLPSQDVVYDQLNNAQNITVVYGDNDVNSYTVLASYPTSHYITKTLLDQSSNIYALEVLSTGGQNGYTVGASDSSNVFFTNVANQYTTNIFRYTFNNPVQSGQFYIKSTGDYYSNNSLGNVLISATDLLGVSTIKVSTSSGFSTNSTTIINLPPNTQQYINNIQFNFGNLGSKYLDYISQLNDSINFLFEILYQDSQAFIGISVSNIFLITDQSKNLIKHISSSIFTFSTLGFNGIYVFDTIGNIYIIDNNAVVTQLSGMLPESSIPISSTLSNSTLYIGVAQVDDTTNVVDRKRIYSLTYVNNTPTLTHNSWSTNIPEPEITFIYNVSNYGIIIGSYSEQDDNYVGKIYTYAGGVLLQIYSTYLRPDYIYFSQLTQRLYVGFSNPQVGYYSGSIVLTSDLVNGSFSSFVDRGIKVAGQIVKQITSTKIANSLILVTDKVVCLIDEISFVITQLATPNYSTYDQKGLSVTVQNSDLNIADFPSTSIQTSFNNIYFEPCTAGFTTSFIYTAYGQIVFDSLPGVSTGFTTSFYLQYPSQNASIVNFIYDNKNISGNTITDIFYPQVPKDFYVQISGTQLTGLGTIALLNGFNTISPNNSGTIVGIQSFVAPKRVNLFFSTGDPTYDLFAFTDGTIRKANIVDLSANIYYVYAKFIDINGVETPMGQYATDTIYSAKQQQISGSQSYSGAIFELNSTASTLNKYVPTSGQNNIIFSGSKIARANGLYESDPFYASDVTSWGSINVLCNLPGQSSISNIQGEYGVSVTLYVATASSLSGLDTASYFAFSVSTINNGLDYSAGIVIGGDISSLIGQWLKFKLELTTASQDVKPSVQSVLITYYGAGKSYFITKTFDTSVQSNFSIPPTIKRGILTANFATNGGQIFFGYTTDPDNTDVKSYTQITPNQIFTFPTPASKIKFGIILKSASQNACFLDDFAAQLDLGQDGDSISDVFFMPPQAAFIVQPYYINGVRQPFTFQFTNKTLGIVSSYNWSFGTSSTGIATYIPPASDGVAGPPANRYSPIVQFSNAGPFTIGLFVTGFIQDGVFFNSEPFTTILTAY